MTEQRLDRISSALVENCRVVEAEIVGQTDAVVADWWAKKNAFRHAFTAQSLLRAARAHSDRPLRILNLSGLSCGHQDFSICAYLRAQGLSFEWLAVEHPASPHLANSVFKDLVQRNAIQILLLDLGEAQAGPLRELAGEADVVLFTEIAEHLEHRQFLKSLDLVTSVLRPAGTLILTTPNVDQLRFRLRHLLALEVDHWGDGHANMEAGIFGHITYYGVPRLRRLLADCGLAIHSARTVDFPYPDPNAGTAARIRHALRLRLVRGAIAAGEAAWRWPAIQGTLKTLGELTVIEARLSVRRPVPFAL